MAAGLDAVAAGDAGAGMAAGGLTGLAGGVEEVVAAGGVTAVCASAPGARRGSPTSAPAIQIRSIMRQNPTRSRTRFMRGPHSLPYSH